jgi:hypothetical protein
MGLHDGREGVVAFNTPPKSVRSTSAVCLSNALRETEPLSQEVLHRCARFVCSIRECDGAAANLLLLKFLLATKPANGIIWIILCLIHRLSLVSGPFLGVRTSQT